MKIKIVNKLILYIILFSSAITLVITSLQLFAEYKHDVRGIEQELEQIRKSYTDSISQAVWVSDRNQLQLILDGIRELPDIVFAEVQLDYGNHITSGNYPEGKNLSLNADLKYKYNNMDMDIGRFTVVASYTEVYNRLFKRLWIILLSNALKTTLVAVFIFYLFKHLVTRHLSVISEFLQSDNLDDLDKPLRLDRKEKINDELSIVANAINELRLRLHRHVEDLDRKQQYLSQTLNSIGDAVITTDANGRITQLNPVAEQLTGWRNKEAQGESVKKVFPIIHATTREEIENPIEKVLSSGEIVYLSNHTTLISKSGEEYQIADSAAPIRDAEANIHGMVLVFNDVTEQYQLRESAAKSRKDLQAIMDHTPAVIYIKDRNGKFVFVNKQFENVLLIKIEEITGKTVYDIFPADAADVMRNSDNEVLQTGQTVKLEEVVPQDDGLHTYMSIKFPMYDENEEIYAVCGISTDITESKRQEEQIRHSSKMDALGKLTGGIAHDYNNMLGVVQGYAELLESELKENPRLAKYIRNIQAAAERSSKLTRKLLSFSRHKAISEEEININQLLLEEQHMLEKTLTPSIHLTFDLVKEPWLICVDNSEIDSAILNMCINSMHAMDGQGDLLIKTENMNLSVNEAQRFQLLAGDYVALSIHDTGCGMDEATIEKIFDPFYTTKGDMGTGLGLSQVYGFVERSGGSIHVSSTPGEGSVFTLFFPRSNRGDTSNPTDAVELAPEISGSETLLIVDDEPSMLELASDVLKPQGYNLLLAETAEQALELLKTEKIDLLITDVVMPDMNGYQLAAQARQHYPHMGILLLSGYAEEHRSENVDSELLENILNKPYAATDLLKRVRDLLKK